MKSCLVRFPVDHSLNLECSIRNLQIKLREIDHLSACLGDFNFLSPIFHFMKLILEQSKLIVEFAITERRTAALEMQLFKIVHDVLRQHLCWLDNQSGDYRLKSVSTLPSSAVDVTFVARGLGNDSEKHVWRFVLKILDETKRRMSRGFWAVEYATLVVDDLQNQFRKLIDSTWPGLPRHVLPLLTHWKYFGNIKSGCSICKNLSSEGEMVMSFMTTLPCDHSFHSECLDSWLQTCRLCPSCKVNALDLLKDRSKSNVGILQVLSTSYCQRSSLSLKRIFWRFDEDWLTTEKISTKLTSCRSSVFR